MSFSQVIRADWVGEGREIAAAFTKSANTKASFDEDIPIVADKEYAFAFDITKAKLLYMLSAEDLLIKTNSLAAPDPDDSFIIEKNTPLIWTKGVIGYYSCPITVDVVRIFLTNASANIARLRIEVLFDSEV